MLDEQGSKWIRIYKKLTIVVFWICIIGGIIGGYGDYTTEFLDFGLGGDDDGIIDFMAWFLIFGGFGCIYLVTNMVIIEFLDNVQIIRKKIERM